MLSMAIAPGWTAPLLPLGLFVILELFVADVVEPWTFGKNTGASSLAIPVATVLWTWFMGRRGAASRDAVDGVPAGSRARALHTDLLERAREPHDLKYPPFQVRIERVPPQAQHVSCGNREHSALAAQG